MKLIQKRLVVGPFQCNCSLLICSKTKDAIVIDAGDEFENIKKLCEKEGVNLKYSVHTHAHLDHIGAAGPLKKWSPQTKIALHKGDEWLFQNLQMQGQMFGLNYEEPPKVDQFVDHEEKISFGEASFEVIHTPGHSPGGICLKFQEGMLSESPTVFSGDTLFQNSIGRTDLWGANHHQLIGSIKKRLFTLDDQTIVHPGHGDSTTIGHESRENPFF